jgi:tetratricopeptide (TPR) repeat protein
VVRISDGRAVAGHAIAAEAYAAFFRGRLHELEGNARKAIRDYEAAIDADPQAGEAWTRLGALQCTEAPEAAERAFERAEAIDARSIAFLRARSVCASARHQYDVGRSTAERALEMAPEDPEVSRLAISANLASGNTQRALALAWAHTTMYPTDTAGWNLLVAASPAQRRAELEAEARTRSRHDGTERNENSPSGAAPQRPNHFLSEQELVNGLHAGDRDRVGKAARALAMTTLPLARRELQMGAYELAYGEARRAHAIDPSRADAWTLALVLADLLDRQEDFEALLSNAPTDLMPLEPELRAAWTALLQRRLGSLAPSSATEP